MKYLGYNINEIRTHEFYTDTNIIVIDEIETYLEESEDLDKVNILRFISEDYEVKIWYAIED